MTLLSRLAALERRQGPAGGLRQDARRVLQFLAEESPDRPLPTLPAVMAAFRANCAVPHGEWLVIRSPAGLLFRHYVDVDLRLL